MVEQTNKQAPPPKTRTFWYWLLLLPYLGLLFPQTYTQTKPSFRGIPFFYWYQFAWVILSAAITGLVYLRTELPDRISK